jgi:hypothetical protein
LMSMISRSSSSFRFLYAAGFWRARSCTRTIPPLFMTKLMRRLKSLVPRFLVWVRSFFTGSDIFSWSSLCSLTL